MVKKYTQGTLVISALITYVMFITIAIFLYVGGTEADPDLTRYAFWGNSLSDLGMIYVYDRAANYYSAMIFTIGTTFFGLSFIPFNIGFPQLFKEQKSTKILSIIASIFGYTAAAGMVLIAFTPHNFSYLVSYLHMVGVYTAYASIFISSVIYTVTIFLNKSVKNVYGTITAIFCAIFISTLVMGLLGLGGDASNIIQQIGQKVGRGLTVITFIVLSIPMLKADEEVLE